jgi:glutathione synthase/RimK-type ligase-like ATP-grasp enzyme
MKSNLNYTYIAKPSKGRGGDGIFLVKKFSDLPKSALASDFIVQRYIDNPYLMDNKKFDFRIYVVIKGIDPLEAYLCEEGLARFCTSNYRKPDTHNIKNIYMHLTNFSLNKNSEKFISPEEEF